MKGPVGGAGGERERPVDAQPTGLGRPGRGLSTCKVPATAAKRAGSEAGTKYSVSAGFSYFVQTREGYPRLWQYEVRVTIRAPTPDDIPNTVRE